MANKPIKCAKCNVPLQGSADPKSEGVFSCPSCGASDTLENIQREIGEYAAEKTAEFLSGNWRELARNNKFLKVTEHPRPKKLYRFVVDLDLHRPAS